MSQEVRQRAVALPTTAVLKIKVGGRTTKFELDAECLDAISRRVYGLGGKANERTLGLLVHGFLGKFIDCNPPSTRDLKDAAYQLGRRCGEVGR